MADENALDLITEIPISDLEKANKINPADLFVLEQDGVAKSLSGDLLISYVMSLMGGHGSITRIAKVKTEGLVDTYRATMEDGDIFEFSVTNGIRGLSFYRVKADFTSASATYPFSDFDTPPGFAPMVKDIVMYSSGELGIVSSVDTTAQTATVFYISISLKGKKGDKGANANVWIKYASQEPTEASHSFGDIPDAWMGIATGHSDTAPTDWKEYKWGRIRGDEGKPGTSVTHKWNGTRLEIKSASGTSSANLQGRKGDPGQSATHFFNGTVLTMTSASGTSSADLSLKAGKGIPLEDVETGDPYIVYMQNGKLVTSAAFVVQVDTDGVSRVNGRSYLGQYSLTVMPGDALEITFTKEYANQKLMSYSAIMGGVGVPATAWSVSGDTAKLSLASVAGDVRISVEYRVPEYVVSTNTEGCSVGVADHSFIKHGSSLEAEVRIIDGYKEPLDIHVEMSDGWDGDSVDITDTAYTYLGTQDYFNPIGVIKIPYVTGSVSIDAYAYPDPDNPGGA